MLWLSTVPATTGTGGGAGGGCAGLAASCHRVAPRPMPIAPISTTAGMRSRLRMRRSNGRVQQPVEVTPVVPVLPEVSPELVDPPMPADVPERELPVVLPVHGLGEALLTVGTVIIG